MSKLKKAVCYYRYSSDRQTEQSIEGQQRVCREFAKNNDYEIIKEYADRAVTGKTDKRPAFLEMVESAKKGDFNTVIVYKLDRFSRKRYDSVVYKYRLEQYGVKVVSATEAISDTAEGKVMTALLEAMAEMYSEELAQKVRRGMNESIIKGNYIGGHILFGYKVVDKKIIIDEENANAVRFMFDEYAKGTAQREIIAELNAKGYRTSLNRPFTNNSIQNLLKNRKFTGEYISKRGQKNNDYYPAIISKSTFLRVQELLQHNRHYGASKKAKQEFILTGKAFCGECGGKLIGGGGTSRTKKRHSYYVCSERWHNKSCDKKYEQKEPLEKLVIRATLNHVLNNKLINAIADRLTEAQNSDGVRRDILDGERRIKRIEGTIKRKAELFCEAESAELRKAIDNSINELSTEKELIEKELAQLRVIQANKRTKAEILAFFENFADCKAEDIEFCKRLVHNFIDKIYVFDDKLIIYYNIFDKSGVTYQKMIDDLEKSESSSNIKNLGQPQKRRLHFLRASVFYFKTS